MQDQAPSSSHVIPFVSACARWLLSRKSSWRPLVPRLLVPNREVLFLQNVAGPDRRLTCSPCSRHFFFFQRDKGRGNIKRKSPKTRIEANTRQLKVPDTFLERTGQRARCGARPEETNRRCITSNGLLPVGDKSRTHQRGTTLKLPRDHGKGLVPNLHFSNNLCAVSKQAGRVPVKGPGVAAVEVVVPREKGDVRRLRSMLLASASPPFVSLPE